MIAYNLRNTQPDQQPSIPSTPPKISGNMLSGLKFKFTKKKIGLAIFAAVSVFLITLSLIIPPEDILNPFQNKEPLPGPEAPPASNQAQADTFVPTGIQTPERTPKIRYWEGALPGLTKEKEIENMPGLLKKEIRDNGITVYKFPAATLQKPDEVWVENGIVVFTSISYAADEKSEHHFPFKRFYEQYGVPATRITAGSDTYGRDAIIFFYKTGIAGIVDEGNNRVYEIHRFQPLSTQEYISKYGSDLHKGDWPEAIDSESGF